jgi:nucleoside-diphosphate-sugar epimerase
MMPPRKLLFGCGYLGARVARLWREAGAAVTIVTRSAAKAEQWRGEGFDALVADVNDPQSLADLPPAETVLFAVGYDRKATTPRSIQDVYAGGLRNVLQTMGNGEWGMGNAARHSSFPIPHSPFVFLYISSTGVYGEADGEWVDESTVCRPMREGGRACLAAEQVLASHPLGARSVVLRPAGIYGPGRIPRAETLRRGEPIDAAADGNLNLIHVDDLARIVLDVERLAQAGNIAMPRTFNVADGHPCLRRDYYAELARLIAAPPPVFVNQTAVCIDVRRGGDKRIDVHRLQTEIAPQLAYPSYREGLAAIVKNGEWGMGNGE